MTDKPGLFDFAGRKAYNLQRWNDVSWDELAAFIGPNAHRFQKTWENYSALLNGEKRALFSWCWPGFLFGFAWFFYRKQWLAGGVLLVIPIILAMLSSSTAGMSGMAVAMGVVGKTIYLMTANQRIHKLREQRLSPTDYQRALKKEGGVSVLGGIIGGTIVLLAILSIFAGR